MCSIHPQTLSSALTTYLCRYFDPKRLHSPYHNKILQNILATEILPICNLENAPWRKHASFWHDVVSIRDLSSKIAPFLASFDSSRRLAIQNSFYFKSLKNTVSIDQEKNQIREYRESLKVTWNFVPPRPTQPYPVI